MNNLSSTSFTVVTKTQDTIPQDMQAEHPKKSFSSRRLTMEIRMQRLKSGLTNVPSRLLHRQQYEHHADDLLEYLIDDILIYIGENFLSPRDLWSISQVSRRCASLFLPLLYTNIDLRLRRVYEVDIKSKGLLKNGNSRESVLLAQRRLRKNLNRYPHLNLRVRTLRWYLDDREMRTNFWDILRNMTNVETLLVCSPYGSPYCPDSDTIDQYTFTPSLRSAKSITSTTSPSISSASSSSFSTLFSNGGNSEVLLPHCKHLTLQGIISLPFAKHVISPPVLESFSIDCTAQWTSPILSYLSSSPSSFPRLTNLALIFPSGKALPDSAEIDLLKSWYEILYAYHTSLSHVTISSRLTSQKLGIYTGPPLVRPSFSLLKTYIFGLFLGEAVIHDDDDQSIRREVVKWERLKVLTLKGRNMVDKTGDVLQRLRGIVPELVVDSSIDKEDTLWHNQFAYSMLLR